MRERADEEVALGADPVRARAALADVGLAELAARHPRDLFSGERERLALAAVVVADPDLLVLDEPTRGIWSVASRSRAGAARRVARPWSSRTTASSSTRSPTAKSRSHPSVRPCMRSKLALAGLVAGAAVAFTTNASALALLLSAAALLVGAASWLDAGPQTAKEITVIATLAAAAAAGRCCSRRSPTCSR